MASKNVTRDTGVVGLAGAVTVTMTPKLKQCPRKRVAYRVDGFGGNRDRDRDTKTKACVPENACHTGWVSSEKHQVTRDIFGGRSLIALRSGTRTESRF